MLPRKSDIALDIVLRRYPTAFVDDDGDWVYVYTNGEDGKPDYARGALGAGGTAKAAWESAARNIGSTKHE